MLDGAMGFLKMLYYGVILEMAFTAQDSLISKEYITCHLPYVVAVM